MPFATPQIRAQKFEKHESEFVADGITDEFEYEARADVFLMGPLDANTAECRRRRGHILRYNGATDEFGVLDGRIVLSFYKADPLVHAKADNWTYFRAECRK